MMVTVTGPPVLFAPEPAVVPVERRFEHAAVLGDAASLLVADALAAAVTVGVEVDRAADTAARRRCRNQADDGQGGESQLRLDGKCISETMTDVAACFGLFTAALAAATVLPMQSEAVLVGLLLTEEYPVSLPPPSIAAIPALRPFERPLSNGEPSPIPEAFDRAAE